MRRVTIISTAALTGVLAAAGTVAVADIVGPDKTINACVANKGGAVRIIGPDVQCKTTETARAWNQQGIQGEIGPQGAQGVQGTQGPIGPRGLQGVPGDQGPQGIVGPDGASAYELWLKQDGSRGTLEEFLASLNGPKGEKGDPGLDGAQGPEGPRGATGPEGLRGPIGPQGPVGPKGDKGDPGPDRALSGTSGWPQRTLFAA